MSLWNWIKTNKFITSLLLVISLFLFKEFQPRSYRSSYDGGYLSKGIAPSSMVPAPMMAETSSAEEAGASGERWVIQESSLSLLVKEVRKTGEEIIAHAKKIGGYMVQASYTKPEEQPYATITVRIPTPQLEETLKWIRSLGIKTISENLWGSDVTEQYTDIEARLATLNKAKAKLEELLSRSGRVRDIADVEVEILNTQQQIDNLVGRQKAIAEQAKLTKITVQLSTDELALSYTPDKVFRPAVLFKLAVRSLLGTLQWFGKALIWIGVYAVIWIPFLAGFFIYRRWKRNK